MKTLILFEALLFVASTDDPPAAWSDDPPAAIVDRVTTYRDVYARAAKGERVTWTGTPDGMPHGTYTLWSESGIVVMRREATVSPVVTFRGPAYDPDHTCDRCGREQRVVEQFLPNGRHTHRCTGCGNLWSH